MTEKSLKLEQERKQLIIQVLTLGKELEHTNNFDTLLVLDEIDRAMIKYEKFIIQNAS